MSDDHRSDDWVHRYFKWLVNYLVGQFPLSHEEAQDIALEALKRGWESRSRIQKAVGPFLRITARNLAINYIRDVRDRSRVSVSLDAMADAQQNQPLPDDEILHRERLKRLEEAIASLSEPLRLVVLLRLREWNFNKIAKHLEITPDAARKRHSDAVQRLRKLLGDIPDAVDGLEILGADDDSQI